MSLVTLQALWFKFSSLNPTAQLTQVSGYFFLCVLPTDKSKQCKTFTLHIFVVACLFLLQRNVGSTEGVALQMCVVVVVVIVVGCLDVQPAQIIKAVTNDCFNYCLS